MARFISRLWRAAAGRAAPIPSLRFPSGLACLIIGIAALVGGVSLAHAATTISGSARYGHDHSAIFAQGAYNSPLHLAGPAALLAAPPESGLESFRLVERVGVAAEEGAALKGEFSIADWSGYPAGVPRPTGPFRLLNGQEYADARTAANAANRSLRRPLPDSVKPLLDIHEIHPVKFGGSPTDIANKTLIDVDTHAAVTTWWKAFQRGLGG